MDMSFANQALCCEYIVKNAQALGNDVHDVPENIDRMISRIKLRTLGVTIDTTDCGTEKIPKLLAGWNIRLNG